MELVVKIDFLRVEFPTTLITPFNKRIELKVSLHKLTAETPTNPTLIINVNS